MGKIKVLVVDDMKDICEYFSSILNKEKDLEVIGNALSGAEAVVIAKELKPDVILMDILMETPTAGLEAVEEILETQPDIRVIILTIHEDDSLLFRAYCAGVMDYILKTDSVTDIANAVRNVHSNQMMLRPDVAKKIVDEFARMKIQQESLLYTYNIMSKLTNSEFEILTQVYQGNKYRQIADTRFVSIVTIKSQVNRILHKFDAKSMKDVINILKRTGFDDIMKEYISRN